MYTVRMHTHRDSTRKHKGSAKGENKAKKDPGSALLSLQSFSIIYKSHEVLTACNIRPPYLQCLVRCTDLQSGALHNFMMRKVAK